jgi:hypothetical protein
VPIVVPVLGVHQKKLLEGLSSELHSRKQQVLPQVSLPCIHPASSFAELYPVQELHSSLLGRGIEIGQHVDSMIGGARVVGRMVEVSRQMLVLSFQKPGLEIHLEPALGPITQTADTMPTPRIGSASFGSAESLS